MDFWRWLRVAETTRLLVLLQFLITQKSHHNAAIDKEGAIRSVHGNEKKNRPMMGERQRRYVGVCRISLALRSMDAET